MKQSLQGRGCRYLRHGRNRTYNRNAGVLSADDADHPPDMLSIFRPFPQALGRGPFGALTAALGAVMRAALTHRTCPRSRNSRACLRRNGLRHDARGARVHGGRTAHWPDSSACPPGSPGRPRPPPRSHRRRA